MKRANQAATGTGAAAALVLFRSPHAHRACAAFSQMRALMLALTVSVLATTVVGCQSAKRRTLQRSEPQTIVDCYLCQRRGRASGSIRSADRNVAVGDSLVGG